MMLDEIVIEKKRIRKEMSEARNLVSIVQKSQWDESICKQLESICTKRKVKVVHTYLPMGSEVNVFPLIEKLLNSGVKIVCPKTLPNRELENRVLVSLDELEEGVMKTFHPKEPNIYSGAYDLIIVPGLAYDANNYRLGYGGGYYDGFLANQEQALKVGVFYPIQQVDSVPTEEHDLSLDLIVSPE